jgi:UDP-2,3-diacylglucosamine hydrolase
MTRFTYFLSDTHLQAACPQSARCFIDFLNGPAQAADALYILGDLFEVWVGDDDENAFNEQIKHSLRQATQRGLSIYLIAGNRDFLIGQSFASSTGVTLLKDHSVVNFYGQETLLLHGDSLCTLDTVHQRFRQKTQHPGYRRCFLSLPLWLRQAIANRIRKRSQARNYSLNPTIMDVSPDAVLEALAQSHTLRMIHGHTHRPAIHHLQHEGKDYQRIVLGDWHQNGSILKLPEKGEPSLITLAFQPIN